MSEQKQDAPAQAQAPAAAPAQAPAAAPAQAPAAQPPKADEAKKAPEGKTDEGNPTLAQIKALTPETPKPAVEVALGEKRRFRAAHGLLVNPFNETRYNTDKSHRVEVDSWTKIQYEAGKLVLED